MLNSMTTKCCCCQRLLHALLSFYNVKRRNAVTEYIRFLGSSFVVLAFVTQYCQADGTSSNLASYCQQAKTYDKCRLLVTDSRTPVAIPSARGTRRKMRVLENEIQFLRSMDCCSCENESHKEALLRI